MNHYENDEKFTDSGENADRPLFEELCEAHYRESAFEGPFGFLIGGMALPSKDDLAREYFEAANHLLERIRQCEVEDFTLTNPILFLYRHSIEMLLKSRLVDPPKRHGLEGLVEAFVAMIKSRFNQDVPGWIVHRIKELASIDPESTAFRYGESYDKARKQHIPVDGELHIDLNYLQEVMVALHRALATVPFPDGSCARPLSG